MIIHVSWWVVFLAFSLVQGLTTGGYLLARRRLGAGWLGLLVLGLTLQVLDYGLASSGTYFRHRTLYFMPLFYSWCYGPLLWAAVRARYGDGRAPAKWHFVPGAVQTGFYLLLAAQSLDTKAWFWQHVHKPVTRYLEYYGAVLSVSWYAAQALRLVRSHPARPRWAEQGLWGVVGFYALAALDPLINDSYLPEGAPKFYLTSLLLPVLTYAAALVAWLKGPDAVNARPQLTAPAEVALSETSPAPLSAGQLLGAAPTAGKAPPDPVLLARLVQVMEGEALYRGPDLSLGTVAQHLGLPPNTVSHLINAGIGQTFTEWVNNCRLAEVERRLLTPDAARYTLLALALEAGFNSKSTFNRAFKERNQLTPSQYQKRYQATLRDESDALGS
ncbi:helix-turn-helix domain-containing protein [Hymenobacter rigui]|uniref:AraC family transcriptional regulator n=1 Tax=Hymenobacter rigui TaxID=334424 RepID=A0A3R9P0F5_9BACT|nr:AraC family transcriptional regulator [Hymenobacter rigui]RSK47509.1 AraC family transcriptional regulator [Hymenobacter rigui]